LSATPAHQEKEAGHLPALWSRRIAHRRHLFLDPALRRRQRLRGVYRRCL